MRALLVGAVLLSTATSLATAQATLPPLPDSTGWGVHVLTATRDPRGDVWVGTYGKGMFRLRKGTTSWERIVHDTTATSISWDFVHAIAFGPRGQIWYGTVGNGWGLSTDGGVTWRNWTFQQLGPEWQYVAPEGIATRGDTTWVGTADGVQLTTNDGASWIALVDSTGPAAKGPADTAHAVLNNEYIRRLGLSRNGIVITNLKGNREINNFGGIWLGRGISFASFAPRNRILVDGRLLKGSPCGLRQAQDTLPCLRRAPAAAAAPATPRTTWFRRPIDKGDNAFIDQTYRYGSTMGGNFQQHQGVEFNNPDGTPVYAIGAGRVVYAGRAEQGALTVAIRHDTTITGERGPLRIFSVYYHNSSLVAKVGDRVTAGTLIARVGNTGRATNDHMHLEVHAAPGEDVHFIVDSLEKFPAYTTNPELWIEPIAGTGIVAGQVFDATGKPVPQARIYGILKPDPAETPFSFAETYGDKAHAHPLYGEHFAVSDVPPGSYVAGVEINGKKVLRRITVEAGKLTWVVFKP